MQETKKLDQLINQKINFFLDHFGCELREQPDKFVGCCPVHGGDNRSGFNFYKRGYWKCRTRGCHEEFFSTPLGFLRAMLTRASGQDVSFLETVNFACQALDTDFSDLPKMDIETTPLPVRQNVVLDITVDTLKENLQIPCPYFSRKFDREIVARKLIGFCSTKGKPMYKRTVVPILDRTGYKVVACQGRSIYPQCPQCKGYHYSKMPCPDYFFPKWKMTRGFCTDMYLYNYWTAKRHAQQSGVLFITESVGNVLRQLEFGLENTVATFGTQFSEFQKEMIVNSGAEVYVYIKDAGEAGAMAACRAKEVLGDKCVVPNLDLTDDIADVSKKYFERRVLTELREWI